MRLSTSSLMLLGLSLLGSVIAHPRTFATENVEDELEARQVNIRTHPGVLSLSTYL